MSENRGIDVTVAITGNQGSGKTRLAEYLKAHLSGLGLKASERDGYGADRQNSTFDVVGKGLPGRPPKMRSLLGVNDLIWQPIDRIPSPPRYVLLRGPSGYTGTPYRYILGHYRPEWPLYPWRDHAGDSVLDGGEMPTEWVDL